MVSAKDFFSTIDLSKLDIASATQIREEILTLSPEDWDLIDNDSEMQKQMEIIKDRIEKEFPTALGLKSNEEKTSENIQKINEANLEKSKLKASEIEKQKEALRKEQEDFEAEKAKYANDIEEMQMLIELTQDTLKDNPNDEDLPLYLELLNDTLQGILTGQKDLLSKKNTNKTAFANGGELVINDTDIASDNEISSLLLKIEKDWGKDSDYYSTIEGIIVGYSKSDSDGDMYLNANGIKRINEELANFDFKYRLTSNGIVDIEELEEDTNNLYVYKFHEERGEVKASVEDMTTGITVWEYNYPDYSLDEDEREFQSSIVEDGFMKNFDDVEGLENYLKSLQILPMDAELISEEDAIQDYQYYANGGSIFSNSNHNTGRSWHLDRQRYNSNEDWEKPLRKRKRKYKNGGSVVDNDIIYAYKQIEKEKQRILSGLTVPYKESFGDVNINVEDVFTENGSEELKYENVGYGGIRFMGNINGKVPTQGLYYKDSQTKNKIQNVIRALDQNNEDKRSIVDDIIKQKGKPKQQLSVLNMIAKRLDNDVTNDVLANINSDGKIIVSAENPDRVIFVSHSFALGANELKPACSIDNQTIFSDTTDQVDGHNAVATGFIHPSWTANIPGATWIWSTPFIEDPFATTTKTFTKTFNVSGAVTSAVLDLATDDIFKVFINGNLVNSNQTYGTANFTKETQVTLDVKPFLVTGTNTIAFEVTNYLVPSRAGEVNGPMDNPGALLYKLSISTESCPLPNKAPTISLNGLGLVNLTVGDVFNDPMASATDTEDGDLTNKIVVTGKVDTTKVGTYTIAYSVKDSGNQ
jgi:hypothetical protein